MDNSRTLEMRIPPDTRYISLVRRGIRSMAESVGFARSDVADVEIAVSEAVTNSVVHGSGSDSEATVVVRCRIHDDSLEVEIEDLSLIGSLPACPEMPDVELESGRGVTIMRALVDELEDSRTESGLRVRMAKTMVRL